MDGNGASEPPRVAPAHPATAGDPGRIREAIKEKTERVPLRALEKRGFRSVQVLDMRTIERIVHEAVTRCLDLRRETLGAGERAELEADAKQEFLKLLAEHKKVVAQKTEIERAREALSAQVDTLREELARQQEALRAARDRRLAGAGEFSLSPESFAEMESKIRKLFGTLISQERRLSLAEAGPQALRGLSELEREIAALLDRLMADERAKLLGKEKQAHEEKVQLLERRIEKLNKALEDTEGALRQVIAAKSIDPGIASIYDKVQGLAADALNYERKKELLKQVFEENLVLQKKVGTNGGHAQAAPLPSPPPALDFAPPLEAATDETAF